MHELGIVMHVVDSIESTAKELGVEKVTKLRMEVGEVSTVVPELFTDAFDWAKKRTQYMQECDLELIIIQGISYCRACRKTYETTKYAKQCPFCGSYDTYLVTGNEITIKDIQVIGGPDSEPDEPDPEPDPGPYPDSYTH
ncbi:MAG: hydrogenase maturation nickel metallochaperone HypA, partial [Clostridia bacterium]|nr:hydrogenase maturation nickel metallochaperone HypA [Clostridia bacterium]